MVGTAFAVAAHAALSALVALPASADPLSSWNDTDAEREFAYDREGLSAC